MKTVLNTCNTCLSHKATTFIFYGLFYQVFHCVSHWAHCSMALRCYSLNIYIQILGLWKYWSLNSHPLLLSTDKGEPKYATYCLILISRLGIILNFCIHIIPCTMMVNKMQNFDTQCIYKPWGKKRKKRTMDLYSIIMFL